MSKSTPYCDYSLVLQAVHLANLLAVAENLTQRTIRVFLALIEIHTVQTFLQSQGNLSPDVAELLTKLTGLSKRSINESLRILAKHQVLSVTDTVQFNDELLEGAELILEKLSNNRSVIRIIPIPRQLLRRLSKSGEKYTILTAITLLLRGASYERGGKVKNRCSIKQNMIAQVIGASIRSVQNAFKILRLIGLIVTTVPNFMGKLIRDGLFVVITFSLKGTSSSSPPNHKTKPKKQGSASVNTVTELEPSEDAPQVVLPSQPTQPTVEESEESRDAIKAIIEASLNASAEPEAEEGAYGVEEPTGEYASFFREGEADCAPLLQELRDQKLSSLKKDQKSETKNHLPEADIYDLDPVLFNSAKGIPASLLIALFIDAVKKGLFAFSETAFFNFFRARHRAKTKGRCPTRLFSHLIRNNFEGITNADENAVDNTVKILWYNYEGEILEQVGA